MTFGSSITTRDLVGRPRAVSCTVSSFSRSLCEAFAPGENISFPGLYIDDLGDVERGL